MIDQFRATFRTARAQSQLQFYQPDPPYFLQHFSRHTYITCYTTYTCLERGHKTSQPQTEQRAQTLYTKVAHTYIKYTGVIYTFARSCQSFSAWASIIYQRSEAIRACIVYTLYTAYNTHTGVDSLYGCFSREPLQTINSNLLYI